MGNLTASEKQRIVNVLDNMDRSKLQRVLASVESFSNWLSDSLHSIYVKVKGVIYSMWESMVCAMGDVIVAVGETAFKVGKLVVKSDAGKAIISEIKKW
ncbi:MAG: hypothetical protein QM487_15450 [Candidatus Marithrix sp.]